MFDFEAIKQAGEQDFVRNTVLKGKIAIINGLIVRRSLKTGEKQALTFKGVLIWQEKHEVVQHRAATDRTGTPTSFKWPYDG